MSTKTPQSAAIYTRISLDRDGEKLGVQRQRQDCEKKAAELGWLVGGYYEDNDISASKRKVRPSYEQMMLDLATGKVDGLIVYDLDRLTRRPIELEAFMDLAEARSIPLANVSGDVDLTGASGRMIARIKGAVARQEADRIAERVSRAALQKAENGRPHGGGRYPLFGYQRSYAVIPEQAAVVREAYQRILGGEGITTVMRDFNDRGIHASSGAEWKRPVFVKMLTNPALAGLRRYKGQIMGDAEWEAIVDRDSYQRLVALMEGRKRGTPGWSAGQQGYIVRYLLSGIAVCGHCTAPLYGSTPGARRKDGTRPVRLVCRSAPQGCGKIVRLAAPIEAIVIEAFLRRVERADVEAAAPSVDNTEAVGMLQAKLDAYKAAHMDGDLDLGDYIAFAKPLREQIKALHTEEAKAGVAAQRETDRGIREVWAKATDVQKHRALLMSEIQAVVVHPSGRSGRAPFDPNLIEIIWK